MNERYGLHRYFIKYLSALSGRPWNCSQVNFTVGARGSLKKIQFQERLLLLGVTDSRPETKSERLLCQKRQPRLTLSSSSFSILRSPEWASVRSKLNWPTPKH